MDSKNIKYIILTIILLILSGLGIFFIFRINSSPMDLIFSSTKTTDIVNTPTSIPTRTPTIAITPTASSAAKITITPTATPTAKTTKAPTATPTAKVTPTSTLVPTVTAIPVSTGPLNFKSAADGFSIDYNSSRKFYQDSESTGNRYTFYLSSGNFAIHVSPSGTWSWSNPDRNFNSTLIVSGQNTYRYDISTQTIVDLQSSTKNYTLQCVHNGKTDLKTECEEFIKSFQLL